MRPRPGSAGTFAASREPTTPGATAVPEGWAFDDLLPVFQRSESAQGRDPCDGDQQTRTALLDSLRGRLPDPEDPDDDPPAPPVPPAPPSGTAVVPPAPPAVPPAPAARAGPTRSRRTTTRGDRRSRGLDVCIGREQ